MTNVSLDNLQAGDEVKVVWWDHAGSGSDWQDLKEMPSPTCVVTWGVVVDMVDEPVRHIKVASSAGWDSGRKVVNPDETVGHVHAILTSCIVSIHQL